MGGRDLRNVKCTCNCTLDVMALCMHESLDFPVQQFHLYMLTRKNIQLAFIVNDMSCIYTQYNLEIPLRSSASYRETSLCLQRHSGEGLLVWWQALQQVLVLSPHVLPPPLKKSHMTDLTFLSLANYTLPLKSKLALLTWDSILISQNSICLSFEKLAFLNIHHSKGFLFFFFLAYLPKISTVGKLSRDSTALLWSLHTNPSKFDLVPNVMRVGSKLEGLVWSHLKA